MGKIKNWTKNKKVKSEIRWDNDKSAMSIVVAPLVLRKPFVYNSDDDWVVHIYDVFGEDMGDSKVLNGFTNKKSAIAYAIEYMRANPNG